MKILSVMIVMILLSALPGHAMFELLESVENSRSSRTTQPARNSEKGQSITVRAYDINMDEINDIQLADSRGEVLGGSGSVLSEGQYLQGLQISSQGFKTETYSAAELIMSKGRIILLRQENEANIDIQNSVHRNSNHFSRNAGTGGIELPEGRTSGEGTKSFSMGMEFKDSKTPGGTDYLNMQYNLNYGLTSRVDLGLNLSDERVKGTTTQGRVESGYMKYNVGECTINSTDLNLALGARASSFSDTEVFGIVGVNKNRNQWNLIAEKDSSTGHNNFGFLLKHKLAPLLSADHIKDNYLIFEMMQDSNDRLSLINMGYRVFLSSWALDLYFKRDTDRDIRTSGIGGSISF